MNIGDKGYVLTKEYDVIPVTITGKIETLSKVSINGKEEKKIVKQYQIESENHYVPNTVNSDYLFKTEEEALNKRHELVEIKRTKLEDKEYNKAKTKLEAIKKFSKEYKHGKWDTVENIEKSLLDLIKGGKLSINLPRVDDLEDAFEDDFEDLFKNKFHRLLERMW